MLRSLLRSLLLILALAAPAGESAAQDAAPDPPMQAARLYNGVDRAVPIHIRADVSDGGAEIVLLDAYGQVLVDPVAVASESIDLAERMPDIWRIRRACYLQFMRHGDPVGSPLVLQPMLERPPIWTERTFRPDGTTRYTRIVGWGNEPPEDWMIDERTEATNPQDDTAEEADAQQNPPVEAEEMDQAPEPVENVFSGLRIYPDRDVILATSEGELRIALNPEEAPNTAWNFRHLAGNGFYTDVIFHRVVPTDRNGYPFVIQGGDPSGTGSGGPGYWLPMEPSELPHDFGVVSMARADDPDSAGSQFFICLSREGTARLDGQYCAFGRVVKGAATIRRITETPLADVATGRPVDPPTIFHANLVPAPPRTPGVGRPDRRVRPDDEAKDDDKQERVPR